MATSLKGGYASIDLDRATPSRMSTFGGILAIPTEAGLGGGCVHQDSSAASYTNPRELSILALSGADAGETVERVFQMPNYSTLAADRE